MFIDIVGYSKLAIDEQTAAVAQLSQIVKATEHFRSAEAAGKLTRIPTGDGMALVFFNSPEAPVRCALEICHGSKDQPHLGLRMGIHSGPVNTVTDVNDRSNVAGDGMNLAQRIMDCADAGHILLSKRVADDLVHYTHWKPNLHDLGEVEVKHGTTISLFNLCGEGFGSAQVPTRIKVQSHRLFSGRVRKRPSLRRKIGRPSPYCFCSLRLAFRFGVFRRNSSRAAGRGRDSPAEEHRRAAL